MEENQNQEIEHKNRRKLIIIAVAIVVILTILITAIILVVKQIHTMQLVQEYTFKYTQVIQLAEDTYMEKEDKQTYDVLEQAYADALVSKDLEQIPILYLNIDVFLTGLPEKYQIIYKQKLVDMEASVQQYIFDKESKQDYEQLKQHYNAYLVNHDITNVLVVIAEINTLTNTVRLKNEAYITQQIDKLNLIDKTTLDPNTSRLIEAKIVECEQLLQDQAYLTIERDIEILLVQANKEIQQKQQEEKKKIEEERKKKEINYVLKDYLNLPGGCFVVIGNPRNVEGGIMVDMTVSSLLTLSSQQYQQLLKNGSTKINGKTMYFSERNGDTLYTTYDSYDLYISKSVPEGFISHGAYQYLEQTRYFSGEATGSGGPVYYDLVSIKDVIIPEDTLMYGIFPMDYDCNVQKVTISQHITFRYYDSQEGYGAVFLCVPTKKGIKLIQSNTPYWN